MVAIMAGAGLGLERSSGLVLGGLGMLGQSALGRSGDNVFVNAANGNLVAQNTDEMLFGLGPDDAISRTYNSLAASGANWGESVLRHITGLTGTVNTSGSTVKRIGWDGSDVTYTYDTGKSAYVGKEGPGGYDTLTFSGSTWTWTDGASRVVELYDNSNGGRITSSTDADGNALSFTYNGGGQLTRVTTQDGGYTDLVYTGSLLTSIVTNYTEGGTAKTLTRVRYGYDGSNRLTTVTVDLTPTNNSVSDSVTYVTTYTYDGSSNRVASITQTDGSSLQVAYTQVGGIYRVSSLTQLAATGDTRVTSFSYDTTNRITTVTDPLGEETELAYDATGQLTSITAPPAVSGADPQVTAFTYNSNGDVLSVEQPDGSTTTYAYDANGNLTSDVNDAGVTVTRTYGSKNELLTVTRYLTPAEGSTAASDPVTTRYAYDTENHLRFVIGAEGDVTEYRYNASGQQTSVIQYTANFYDISALTPTSTLSESNLTTWLAGISDKSRSKRTDTTYDFRGNVATVTAFGKANTDGTGDTTATTEISATVYVYDQFGRLVSRQPSVASTAEVNLYDGLGRLISTTDFASRTTTFAFNDASSSTVVTLANGSTRTSTYNLAGELISYSEAGTGVSTATTTFHYDDDGRLRIVTDATGRSTYSLYDAAGRKTAEVGPDGAVVEYMYDGNDRLNATVRYARKLTTTELASLVDGSGNPTTVDLATIRPDADDADRWDWRIYDAADRLIETIDANGAAIVYTYDGAGRLITTRGYALMFDSDQLAEFKATPPLELQIPSSGFGFFSMLMGGSAAPDLVADDATVKVDAVLETAGNVLANDTDSDGDTLTVVKVNGLEAGVGTSVVGTYGTLVLGDDGRYVYTLNNDAENVQSLTVDQSVEDVFEYTVSDGDEEHETSSTLTVTVVRVASNNAPTVDPDQASVTIDDVLQTTGNVLGNDVDPNGDPLTVIKVNGQAAGVGTTIVGTYGTLVLGADGQYTYTLDNSASNVQAATAGQTLQDVFEYTASDGKAHTATVQVPSQNLFNGSSNFEWWSSGGGSVSIDDDAAAGPAAAGATGATADAVTMAEGSFIYRGTDVEGMHTFSVWARKVSGTGEFRLGYYDGSTDHVESFTATSAWQRFSLPFDGNGEEYSAVFLGNDGDGSNEFELWGAQLNGGATATPYVETIYDPVESTTVEVTVVQELASNLTIKITRPGTANTNPSAVNDAIFTSAGAPITFNPLVNDADPQGATLSVASVSTPAHGAATINVDGTITYTPTSGYAGPDAFTYTVSNGAGGSAAASVMVTVAAAANIGPEALNDSVSTRQGTALSFSPIANDVDADGDPLTITSVGTPAHGTVTINGAGILTYKPSSDYVGADSFTYTISDGRGAERTGTVTVSVTSNVNSGPSAIIDHVSTSLETAVTFNPRRNDYDVDGDGLTIVSVDQPPSGTVTINPDGTLTYTPPDDFTGQDDFYYTISDGHGGVSTNAVFMTVYAANQFTSADTDSFGPWSDGGTGVDFDTTLQANYLGEGYPAFLVSKEQPMSDATVSGGYTYPGAFQIMGAGPGETAWEVEGGDKIGIAFEAKGLGAVTEATVSIVFWDEDWENVGSSDPITMTVGDWTRIEAMADAPEGAKHAAIVVDLAAAGEVPDADSFGLALRKTQWVQLEDDQVMQLWPTSTPGNSDPVAVSDIIVAQKETAFTFNPRLNDSDADNDALTIVAVTNGTHGTVTVAAGGTITYMPTGSYVGTDSFTYTVSDGRGGTSTATVNVVVAAPTNTAPSAVADQVATSLEQAVTFNPRANDSDADGDGLTITAVGTAAHGTVVINDGWSVTYTPEAEFIGTDSFTYSVSDGRGGLTTATATVTVYPANEFVSPGVGGVATWSQDGTGVDFDVSVDNNYLGQGFRSLILEKTAVSTPYYNGSNTFAGMVGIFGAGSGTDPWDVVPGESLGVALEAKALGETTYMSVRVWFWDEDWVDAGVAGWDLKDISDWTRLETTLKAPENAAHAAVVVQLSAEGDPPSGSTFGAAIRKTQLVRLSEDQAMQPWPAPTPVNTTPLALADSVSVTANTSLTFNPRLNDNDADRDGLIVASVGAPAHGVASINAQGLITYVPTSNYVGVDSFTYTISDGRGGTATASVSVNVVSAATNQAPTTANDTASTSAGLPVTFNPRTNDSDADGDALVITAVGAATHGDVVINDGATLTYTPDSGYVGTDSFTYTVSDGRGGVTTATATITVYPENEFVGPAAGGVVNWSQDGTGADFDLTVDQDYLGQGFKALVFEKSPTSTPDFDGTNTYAGMLGIFGAGSGTDAWDVVPGESLGVALEAKALGSATRMSVRVWFWDASWNDVGDAGWDLEDITDWTRLETTLVAPTGAAHAAVLVQLGAAGNATSATSFGGVIRKAQFLRLSSGQAMQAFPGEEVANNAPTAAADTATTIAGRTVVINPLANDADDDNDALTLTDVGVPAHGVAVINTNGTVSYTPADGYTGTDSFTYTVSDGRGGTATQTITVTVAAAPSNTGPAASNDSITTAQGVGITFNPRNNDTDADGDALTLSSVSTPSHGTATINADGTITYTPSSGYNGSDSFTYTISDGRGGTSTATVNVTVQAASSNTAPVATADSITAAFNGAVTFNPRTNDTDANGDTLSLTAVGSAAHGVAVINANGTITYTANTGYSGSDSFTYSISDGRGGASTATVSVTVSPAPNAAPVAALDTVSTRKGQAVTFDPRINDGDADGNAITITATTTPSHGAVVINADGTLTYTPTSGYAGSDSFGYTISDGHGGTATASISVAIADVVNTGPTAGADLITTAAGGRITFNPLRNDTDTDGDALTLSAVGPASNGTATIASNGTITYRANLGFSGVDSFTYTVSDGRGGTAVASVEVNVLSTADLGGDRVVRNFYDRNGRLVGVLDGEGYLTRTKYDGAGQAIETIAYATAAEESVASSGTFAQVLTSVGTSSHDVHKWNLYDGRGFVRASINGEGDLTRYHYTALGDLDQVIGGQKLDPAALISTPPTLAGLPSASGSTVLETTSYTRDAFGLVQTETKGLTGGGSETTTYTYDNMRRLVSQTQASGTSDARTFNQTFDARGRLTGELSGVGSAALAALGSSPTSTQIANIYATYGTTYAYDSADRLISKTTSNGVDASGNKTLFYYDANGRLAYEVNPLGEVVHYVYDVFGERTDTITYGTRIASGTLASLTGGEITTTLTSAITSNSAVDSTNSVEYGHTGRVGQATDPLGAIRNYLYNAFGELVSEQDPITGSTSTQTVLTYDRRGLLQTRTRDAATGGLQLLTKYGYDAFGRVMQTTDPAGQVRSSGYDRAGRVISETDAFNRTTTYEYDGRGAVVSHTDRNGKITTYQYKAFNREVKVITPEGLTTTTLANAFGETISIDDGGGRTTTWTYDKDGAVKTVTDELGNHVDSTYDTAGRLWFVIDARGSKTTYTYDAADRVMTRKVDDGGLNLVTGYAYDPKGQQFSVTDPDGRVTTTSFDLAGRRTSVVVDTGSGHRNLKTTYDYDEAGRVLTLTEADGADGERVTEYTYDNADRLTQTHVDPAGLNLTTRYTYDQVGNAVARTDADGAITRFVYDAENRLVFEVNGAGGVTQTTYDGEGRVASRRGYATAIASSALMALPLAATASQIAAVGVSASDHVTSYVYDGDGRLRYRIGPTQLLCEYVYDGSGNVVRTTEYATALNPASSYTYASITSEITTRSLASVSANRVTRMVYDLANRATFSIDATGQVTAFAYDGAGNVTKSIRYGQLYTSTTTPDQGAMTTWVASLASGVERRTTRTVYDTAGRAAFVVDALNYVTETQYDADGRVTKSIRYAAAQSTVTDSTTASALKTLVGTPTSSAAVTSYAYDTAGRLTDVTDPMGAVTHMTLDGMGRALTTTTAYGTAVASTTEREYDAAGRVMTETRALGTSAEATTGYGYDGMGRVLTVTDPRGSVTTRTYDAAGRLQSERTPLADSLWALTGYNYDAFGNRTEVIDPLGRSGFFYYDKLNRQELAVDPEGYATATTYSLGGEPASITRYARQVSGAARSVRPTIPTDAKDATTTFQRDKLDRLTAVIDAEGYSEGYQLNAFGDRIATTNKLGGTTTRTFDALGRMTAETLPIQISQVVRSSGEDPPREVSIATSVTNTYTYDARGNLHILVEASNITGEARTTTYEYDLLDRVISKTGNLVETFTDHSTTGVNVTPVEAYHYDLAGNLIETIAADGARTLFYYDRAGHKIAQVNAMGEVTQWDYDDNGNVVQERAYATRITLPTTVGASPPSVSGLYRQTDYTYDRADRLIRTQSPTTYVGEFLNGAYQLATQRPTTQRVYDAAGNVIQEIDARGQSVFIYYDRAGRKIAQVDQANYLTTYEVDAEGNVTNETRYATRLRQSATAALSVTELRALTGPSQDDRITRFTYDRNGRRLTEERLNVNASDTRGWVLAAGPTNAKITYAYDGMGNVVSKQQATLDVKNYRYDKAGRLISETGSAFVNVENNWRTPLTQYYYDPFGNLTQVWQNAVEHKSGTTDRLTTYAYIKGQLAFIRDASGFIRFFYHDAAGRVTRTTYVRETSNSEVTVQEGTIYQYDAAGRAVSESTVVMQGGAWVDAQVSTTQYNAFGEVTGQGTNSSTAQVKYSYDAGGRAWRSNAGDGVTKLFFYDANGNRTLTVSSTGHDMSAFTSPEDAIAYLTDNGAHAIGASWVDGVVVTMDVYDARNQSVETRQPTRELGAAVETISQKREYDAFGDVTLETNALGGQTRYTYTTQGKVKTSQRLGIEYFDATNTGGRPVPAEQTFYDAAGRKVAVIDQRGNLTMEVLVAGTGYDGEQAMVAREIYADQSFKNFEYDAFFNLRAVTDELGQRELRSYDNMGRLTYLIRPQRANGEQLIQAYRWDGLGQNIKQWFEFGPNRRPDVPATTNIGTQTTDYDALGRVTKTVDFGDVTTTYNYTWNSGLAAGSLPAGGWTTTTTSRQGTATQQSDSFGRTLSRTDAAGLSTSYSYDAAGRLTGQTNNDHQSLSYEYYNTGLVETIVDNYNSSSQAFTYDMAGNVKSDIFTKGAVVQKSTTAKYDFHGRMTEFKEAGAANRPVTITYGYTATDDVRRAYADFADGDEVRDYWYAYDQRNRLTVDKGYFSGGAIKATTDQGVEITYDKAGQRTSARSYVGGQWRTESYQYTTDGYLKDTSVSEGGSANRLVAHDSHDALGRTYQHFEYNPWGQVAYHQEFAFDSEGRILTETVTQNGTTTKSYTYVSGTLSSPDENAGKISSISGGTSYTYDGFGRELTLTNSAGTSTFGYDSNGQLESVAVTGGSARTVGVMTDLTGQAVLRTRTVSGVTTNDSYFYSLAGTAVGRVGTEEAADFDYVRSVQARSMPMGGGELVEFSSVYEPINPGNPGLASTDYVVQAGDTLRTIALRLWGDEGLWYVLAETNGLTGAEALAAGRILQIPNKVVNAHNTTSTFKVYDPGDVLGSVEPSLATPAQQASRKKKGCGVIGKILVVVVAVAVTVVTAGAAAAALGPATSIGSGLASLAGGGLTFGQALAVGAISGAAGSIAGQAVGIATGVQDSFSWKGVALAAVAGAIGGGVSDLAGGTGLLSNAKLGGVVAGGAARGAVSSIATQGLAVATGLQRRFDWAGVAVGAIGGAATAGVSAKLADMSTFAGLNVAAGTSGNVALSGAAGALAGAAAQSLATGTSFGDNLLSSLPSVIANTVGNAIAGGIQQREAIAAANRATTERARASFDANGNPLYPVDEPITALNVERAPPLTIPNDLRTINDMMGGLSFSTVGGGSAGTVGNGGDLGSSTEAFGYGTPRLFGGEIIRASGDGVGLLDRFSSGVDAIQKRMNRVYTPDDLELVYDRTVIYNWMDDSLNSGSSAYRTNFFGAAAQVTGAFGLSLGQTTSSLAGFPFSRQNERLINDLGAGLYKDVNAPLYRALYEGDGSYKLANGTTLGQYAGKSTKTLDYALVHNEQTYVQKYIDNLPPAQRSSFIKESNRALYYTPNEPTMNAIMSLHHRFDFGAQADREAIGRSVTDYYRNNRSK